jgi:hypothetical protein
MAVHNSTRSDTKGWEMIEKCPDFHKRIAMNLLIGSMSRYEQEFGEIDGALDDYAARTYLRCRINKAIAAAYPDLSKECAKQVTREVVKRCSAEMRHKNRKYATIRTSLGF